MPRKPVIAVVGTGQKSEPAVSNARELGRLIAEQGWVLITGGRDSGVMKAANEGAKRESGSLAIGVLPDRDTEISDDVDVAIITDTGEARNNIIVLSADIMIACGVDDPGTASEVSLALKARKPVIIIGADDSARGFFTRIGGESIRFVDSSLAAIEAAHEWLGRLTLRDRMVLKKRLKPER
jgi:uncharacterized protein (TIGR00725 family)